MHKLAAKLYIFYLPNTANHPKRNIIATYVSEFLTFISDDNRESYISLCESYRKSMPYVRDLPKYADILLFDYTIRDFFQNCNEDEKIMYYPIRLWWLITTIIPLRISEFLLLKKDCSIMKPDNSYWITVPRTKKKSLSDDPRMFDIVDTVQINKEVHELIQSYLDYTNSQNDSDYLISFRVYPVIHDKRYPRSKPLKRSNLLITNKTRFNSLLKTYYKKIVEDKYGYYDIDTVSCGDTRHFAFCNMMLQGWNMLSIARMGGHTQLRTQLHYHAHLDYFVQSWVYNLAQRKKMDRLNQKMPQSNFSKQQIISKSKIYSADDFQRRYEVEFGYCTYSPEKCEVGDCRFCPHYLFDPKVEQDKAIKWLMDCSDVLGRRIEEQVALLRQINLDLQYDIELLEYQATGQERLFSVANELNRLMQQKANVDSYLEED